LKTITLSYTMFPVEKKQPVASSTPAAGSSNKVSDTEASLGG
jgi:cytochrome c oxidase assembly protein subunit 11